VRNSRASSAAACGLTLALAAAAGGAPSAHRLDEYLQAARIAIDPDRVQLDLDLTPGVAVAGAILSDIDGNRDGSASAEEQRAYAAAVVGALDLAVDGRPLALLPGPSSFPRLDAVRRGEGTISLHAAALLPRQPDGVHRVSFRNRHHPDRSVYLANAMVPDSDRVAVTEQRRDSDQRELVIEYVLRPAAPPAVTRARGLAAAAGVSALVVWGSRALRRRRLSVGVKA
jgi:hypothetical protein